MKDYHEGGNATQTAKSPRSVTRGSEFTPPPPSPTFSDEVICSFDWYRGTSPLPSQTIIEAFLNDFGGEFELGKGMHSYAQSMKHNDLSFTVMFGGHNGGSYFEARGQDADPIAYWLRSKGFPHQVSRADVAFDFSLENGFDKINSLVEPIVRQTGVACRFIGDPLENDPSYPTEKRKGRTYYYGSNKSDCFVRLYEKGFERRGKGQEDADPNWVRFEVQISPQKSRKKQASNLSAFDLVGFSKWATKALSQILVDVPTVLKNPDKQEKTMEYALSHMASQYKKHIRSYIEQHGWQEFNKLICDNIVSFDERHKKDPEAPKISLDDI